MKDFSRVVYLGDVPRDMKHALLSAQGTACPETVLLAGEYTPENRAKIEREFCGCAADDPRPGTWTDVTDNDAL